MEEKKKKHFVAFLDENNRRIEGYFEILEETPRLKIKSGKNTLTIPETRLLKIKVAND